MVSDPGRDNGRESANHLWLGVIGLVVLVSSLACIGSVTMAQETSGGPAPAVPSASFKVDSGDTAWVLTSSALVLAMTMPGLAPASGFIGPLSAMAIGCVAGATCYAAIVWKGRMGYDDSLDVVGIHGVGGIVGLGCKQ